MDSEITPTLPTLVWARGRYANRLLSYILLTHKLKHTDMDTHYIVHKDLSYSLSVTQSSIGFQGLR